MSCEKNNKKKTNNWIAGSGMILHRCPKCASLFEKIDGCPEMECAVCFHKWCWNCGSKINDNIWHNIFYVGCFFSNYGFLNP